MLNMLYFCDYFSFIYFTTTSALFLLALLSFYYYLNYLTPYFDVTFLERHGKNIQSNAPYR